MRVLCLSLCLALASGCEAVLSAPQSLHASDQVRDLFSQLNLITCVCVFACMCVSKLPAAIEILLLLIPPKIQSQDTVVELKFCKVVPLSVTS